jgi:type I restriction enzyme S subunit
MTTILPQYVKFSELVRWDVKYFWGQIKSKYPLVPLANFIRDHNEKIRPFEYPNDTFKILGVNNTDGIFHAYDALGKEIKQPYKKVSADDFAYNPYRINVGSIGKVPPEHDGAFISPAYVVFSIDKKVILPQLFWFILKSDFFNQTLRAATAGSVRMNLTYPLLETLKIPIPPLPVQQEIVNYLESYKNFIANTDLRIAEINKETNKRFLTDLGLPLPKTAIPPKFFASNWKAFNRWSVSYNQTILSMIDLTKGRYPVVELGSILEMVQYGTSEKANTTGEGIPVLRMNNIKNGYIDLSELKHIKINKNSLASLSLLDGDILVIRTNGSHDLVGTCAVFHEKIEFVYASYLIRLRLIKEKAKPDFVAWYINSPIGRQQVNSLSRHIMQNNINSQELRSLLLPLPPLNIQQEIMDYIEINRKAIDSKKNEAAILKEEAQEKIENLILGTLSVEDL